MRTFGDAGGEEIKDGHADSDAVGDLFEDGGLRAIGDFGSDFRAAVNRPRMKNQRVGFGEFHALGVELIEQDVIALREGSPKKSKGRTALV